MMRRLLLLTAVFALNAVPASAWQPTPHGADRHLSGALAIQRSCSAPEVPPFTATDNTLIKACELAADYSIAEVADHWAKRAVPLRCVYITRRRDRCWVAEGGGYTSNGRIDKNGDLTIEYSQHWVDWVDIVWHDHRAEWIFQ